MSERVRLCFTFHQQLRLYGYGAMIKSLIQQTVGARDQTQVPWIQSDWFIHYIKAIVS